MYKLLKGMKNDVVGVSILIGNMLYSIPFEPDNTDYANFKKEVLAGAELQDSEGQAMSQEEANQFIATLP